MTENHPLCPSCHSENTSIFHTQNNAPVHSVLVLPEQAAARGYTRGNLRITFCADCGFIFNSAYDGSLQEYSDRCEETQGFSPTFTAFARQTAESLIADYDLHGKSIIEIGSGKGEFLALLCSLGGNTGTGFDPAYVEGRLPAESVRNITFIRDFFSEKYAGLSADFICCRMTLEHIDQVDRFLAAVRKAAGNNPRTVVHFQVPDVLRILSSCAFEDIYYEHCSYFSQGSLARLFRRNGFELIDLRNEYRGQYLVLDARPTALTGFRQEDIGEVLEEENDLARLSELVSQFPARFQSRTDFWHRFLSAEHANGRRTVLWGSGSKAVSFLTSLGITHEVEYIVDINPNRQGTFMAGTGHRITSPEFLKEYRPDTVIVMNAIYVPEIREKLASLGCSPELLTLEAADGVLENRQSA